MYMARGSEPSMTSIFLFLLIPRPPTSTLFPYTTLFRSQSGAKDGPGPEATFRNPKGIRADRDGNLYVVDTENHSVRKIEAGTWKVMTAAGGRKGKRSEEHTSELQSHSDLVCRLLLEKKK